jgi:hypothetical protein
MQMVDMNTRQRTDNLLIGFYQWPREQLFYKEETRIGQPEEASQGEPHAFKNPLEGFLLCNTPSELYRLSEGSDVLIVRVNEGSINESHKRTCHIPLRNNVGQSLGNQEDY